MLRLSSHSIRLRSSLARTSHRIPTLALSHPRHFRISATKMSKVDDILHQLKELNIAPTGNPVSHESSTSPASWRDALGKASGVPEDYSLVKTLVFKPKTSKTAAQTPLVVVAREETATDSSALGKKYNLKDLRLANDDLLTSLLGVSKDACMHTLPSLLVVLLIVDRFIN